MSCILHIDTSTNVCSVAVSENGGVIFNKENHSGPNHAESLGSDVDEALSFADSHAIPVDAVAISSGPGSYTGLRIGVSMAKGICYGQGLHLVSVPTLELLCVPVLLRHDEMEENALLIPMIDARRMEVYTAIFEGNGTRVTDTEAKIIDGDSFSDILAEGPVLFIGDGAAKCTDTLTHPNAHFIQTCPKASAMLEPAERELSERHFRDVAYFEPFYLKEFVATTSKKHLF